MNLKFDNRYYVNLEFTGEKKQKFVARFCGEYIGSEETKNKAKLLCIFHDDERKYKLL